MERQQLNVFRMRLLGAEIVPVTSGAATLKDATSEAIRDWVTNVESTHYILGSAAGPHPYPMMVRLRSSRHLQQGCTPRPHGRCRCEEACLPSVCIGTVSCREYVHPLGLMTWVGHVQVRDFQSVIGKETRAQCLEQFGGKPDVLLACVGGGSNAIGLFHEFVDDKEVRAVDITTCAPQCRQHQALARNAPRSCVEHPSGISCVSQMC